jgi:hypothetical protein
MVYSFSELKLPKIILIIAKTRANSIAEKKPAVLNPFNKLSTNKTIKTDMIKDINPKLKTLIGKVKILRIKPIVALIRANKTATKIAVKKPSTLTPGIIYAATTTAIPINKISIKNFIITIFNLKVAFFYAFLFCACNSQSNNLIGQQITISMSNDSASIIVKGIDLFILKELSADSLSNKSWGETFSVYPKTNEDNQDFQYRIPGKYKIQNGIIYFTPLQPFKKEMGYLVEFYIYQPNTEITQQLKTKNSPFKKTFIKKDLQF